MPLVLPADEPQHPPGADPHWQESYFNWSDAEGRAFGLTRIGYRVAERRIDGLLVTMRDGRRELVYPALNKPLASDGAPILPADGLRAGALTFRMEEPLKRWRVQLSGHDEVDLTWTAFTPAVDFGHDDAVTVLGQRHFEQSGAVSGHMRIGGREHEIRGFGQRDKSWGPRDWANVGGWEWIAAQCGEDFAFNATQTTVGGRTAQDGFVFCDGACRPLQSFTLSYAWGGSHVPSGAELVLIDVDGGRHHVEARALAQVPLYKRGLMIQETHAAFSVIRGGHTIYGAGVLEHAWHAGLRGVLTHLPRLLPVLKDAAIASLR